MNDFKTLAWHFVYLFIPGVGEVSHTAVMVFNGRVDRTYRLKSIRMDAFTTTGAGYGRVADGNLTLQCSAGNVVFNPADQNFNAFPPTSEDTNVALMSYTASTPEIFLRNTWLYPGINYDFTTQVFAPVVGTPFNGTDLVTVSMTLNLEYAITTDQFSFQ